MCSGATQAGTHTGVFSQLYLLPLLLANVKENRGGGGRAVNFWGTPSTDSSALGDLFSKAGSARKNKSPLQLLWLHTSGRGRGVLPQTPTRQGAPGQSSIHVLPFILSRGPWTSWHWKLVAELLSPHFSVSLACGWRGKWTLPALSRQAAQASVFSL